MILRDQGPALTTTLTKEIWATLGVQLALHIPYHPQSSGKVERMNGTLKNRMLKMAQETNMSWPIALFSVRHTPRGNMPYPLMKFCLVQLPDLVVTFHNSYSYSLMC